MGELLWETCPRLAKLYLPIPGPSGAFCMPLQVQQIYLTLYMLFEHTLVISTCMLYFNNPAALQK